MVGKGKEKNEVSVFFNSRIREDLFKIITIVSKETGLTKRDILELSFCDFIYKANYDLKFEGIDLKEHSNLIKLEKLRNLAKLERNEFLSGQLVIPRMRSDIFKLIIYHRNNKNLIKLIEEYIEIRKKEIAHYKDKDVLLDYVKDFEELLKKKEIDLIKRKIEDEMKIVKIEY